jgi:small conductance mechanosensitive channel
MEMTLTESITKLYDKLETWMEQFIKMLPNLLIALFVVIIFWIISKYVFKWMKQLFEKTHFNESIENLLANIIRFVVIAIGIVIALGILSLQKTVFSLLAGVGVIGLALGFAFQDLASNFIAGIMLAVRAPIKIGDVIEIKGTQGSVIDIRLRDTHIRNFDGQDIFIPNKDFTTNELKNYSSYGKRKIAISVGVGYEDDAHKATQIIQKTLKTIDGVLSDPEPASFVESLGDSSVNIFGHVWFNYPGGSYFQVRHDATVKIKKALEDEGFNIPFPIRTLDIPSSTLNHFINKQ